MGCNKTIQFQGEADQRVPVDASLKNKAKVEKGATPMYQCGSCNRLSSRVYKAVKEDEELEGWSANMSKEEKQTFFAEKKDFLGAELTAVLKSYVTKTEEKTAEQSSGAVDNWLDEVQLMKKYEGREEQAINIIASAPKKWHPTRKVQLYNDYEFTGSVAEGVKRKEVSEVEASTQQRCKKAPRVKRELAEPDGQEKNDKPKGKGLSDSAKARIQRSAEKANDAMTNIQEALDASSAEDYKDYVAPGLLAAAGKAKAELVAAKAETDVMLEPGWTGKPGDVEAKLKGATAAANQLANKLKTDMEVADEIDEALAEKKGQRDISAAAAEEPEGAPAAAALAPVAKAAARPTRRVRGKGGGA